MQFSYRKKRIRLWNFPVQDAKCSVGKEASSPSQSCLLCTSRTSCRKFLDCWWQPHGMSQLLAAFSLVNERILEA
ncbi:hypothetical protein DV515_00011277 [Chloebia gouldiae]|uniref:Uncharacterized protein n=1 Tax=Chloebia gouldiae TaxID=44316 RepID=A0A3L8S7Z1_CHLGU|nr:hypothetical protein DV515_00011277 [Chloebia gouldiae]